MTQQDENRWSEQERTDRLEAAAGGPDKTFRLMRMLSGARGDIQHFQAEAKRAGYTEQAIHLMLDY